MLTRIKSSAEERYRSLFERMTEGFALHEIVCDNKGVPCDYRFLEVNPAFERLTGLKQEKVVGRLMSEVLPDDDPTWVRRYGEVALTGRSASFQNYSTQLKRHYEVFAYCPAPQQFAVLFLDATERKHLETALELAARFPEENPNPVMRLGEGHIVDFANPSAKELLKTQGCTGGGEAPAEIAEPAVAALKAGVPRQIEKTYSGRTYLFSLTPISQWGYVNLYATDITERKQAEEALRKREEENLLLAGLLENSDQPFAVGYPDGRLGILNGAFERLTGFSRAELAGMDWARALTPPEWREVEQAKLEELHRTGQPVRYEKAYLRKDGSRVPIELLVHLRRNAEGQPAFYYSFLTDLTERKQAEAALRESESRERARAAEFEALMEAAPVGIFVSKDTECSWMSGNRAAYDLLRRTRGSNLSKSGPEGEKPVNFRAMKDGKEIPLPELPMQKSAASGYAVRDHEMDFVFEDGVTLNILGNVVPLLDESGRPRGAVGTFLDITERKRAEDALRESAERFRVLSEAMPQIVWTAEATGARDYYNSRALEYAGASLTDLNDWKWTSIIHPDDREETLNAWRQAIATGQIYEIEHRLRRADGEFRWHLTRAVPLRNDQGTVIQWIGTATDIHDQKIVEQELDRRVAERTAELRESQALTNAIVESTSDFIWTVDPERFGLLTFNGGLSEHFLKRGVRLQKGMRPEEAFPDQNLAARWRGIYQRTLSEGSCTVDYESPTAGSMLVTANLLKRDGKVFGISAFGKDITERVRAERARQESEEAFHALAELVPQLVWMCTPDGLNVYFNQRWVDYSGMSLEESYGRGWNTPFHPDDKQPAWQAWNHAVETGDTYNIECRLRRADGIYRWFLTRGVPLRDSTGNVVKWFGTCTDIDDLKRAEAELHRLNRALRALSASNQAMVRAQDDSELLRETCRILVDEGGYRFAWVGFAEQDAEKTVRPVAHAGIEEGYLETVKITWADTERGRGPTGTAIRTCQPSVCQNMLEDPRIVPWREDAARRGYASSCALPLCVDGKSIGALTVYSTLPEAFDAAEAKLLAELVEDVTYGLQTLRTRGERQRAMETLEKANAYNRSLLEASLDTLVTIAPDGKVTDVNSATEKVTGRLREELIGADFSDYFTDPEKARLGYQQVFREGLVQDYELEVRRRDGSTTPVLYNASVYRDEGGEVVGVFAAARDITTRKRAEEEVRRLNAELEQRVRLRTAQLEASNKELESFSYSVSHDLRAPLRAIDGFSRILLEEYRSQLPSKAQRYLDFVREGASHMGNLIDGLLALSRLGRQELKRRPVEVAEIVRLSMDDIQADVEASSAEFVVGSLPSCDADPLLVRQVFVNLLSNALKFSRKQEKVRIEIGALRAREAARGREAMLRLLDPDSWVYYVRDNGVGFDMRYADKLFGVFQRLHRQEEFKGTGIGLATVQQIVHKHGGQVWAEAEVGKGATFYFTIGPSVGDRTDSHDEIRK